MSTALRLVRDSDGGDELPPLVAWELFMRGAGRAERTVGDGLRVMGMLERHANKPVEHLASVDVSRFLARPELKPSSRASYFGAIAMFFKWYGDNGGADITARLPRPRAPKGAPRPVSRPGLRALLETRMHARTRVMILLAALAGLRVHEIAKIRGEDFDLDARTLRVTGKGSRTDTLPLHDLLVAAVLIMPRRGWWFPGNSRRPGQHVHSKAVSDIIGDVMRRSGVPGTPHCLRHYFGSSLVAAGTDLRTAQTLLRHQNLNTTAIYVNYRELHQMGALPQVAWRVGDGKGPTTSGRHAA